METENLSPERRAELMGECITLINRAHGLPAKSYPEGNVRDCFVQIACSMLLAVFDYEVEEAKHQLDHCSRSFCAWVDLPDEV